MSEHKPEASTSCAALVNGRVCGQEEEAYVHYHRGGVFESSKGHFFISAADASTREGEWAQSDEPKINSVIRCLEGIAADWDEYELSEYERSCLVAALGKLNAGRKTVEQPAPSGDSYITANGMTWPNPEVVSELDWQLRYGGFDQSKRLYMASVCAAYVTLFEKHSATVGLADRGTASCCWPECSRGHCPLHDQ